MMRDHTCGWTWHSAPTPIAIEVINDARAALEHGRTVLAANADQFATLTDVDGSYKQRRAIRTGAVVNGSVIDASSPQLHAEVRKHGSVFLSKTPMFCHKTLFTSDRVLAVTLRMEWESFPPWNLRSGKGVRVIKNFPLTTKALLWTGFVVSFSRFHKVAGFALLIGAFYILRLAGIPPLRVIGMVGVFGFEPVGEVI